MEGELDPFDFVLAEQLHCTVEELYDRMSNSEYHRWRAFYTWRQAMAELEAQRVTNAR